jgi:uncharacterized protein YbcI
MLFGILPRRLFFVAYGNAGWVSRSREVTMEESTLTKAEQIALAVNAFEKERTGHPPKTVSVVLGDETLVITLHGALSLAERTLAQTPDGIAQVREFHRELFNNSSDVLRREIERITGVKVREAAAEVETNTGTIVQVFTTGTVVQVYLLAHGMSADAWSGGRTSDRT